MKILNRYTIAIVLATVLCLQVPKPEQVKVEAMPKNAVNTQKALIEPTALKQTPTPKPVQSEPPTPTPQIKTVEVVAEPVTPKDLAQSKAASYGWIGNEWIALEELWHKESGWNPNARNKSSGACGIPQALPCNKIPNPTDTASQIDWGLGYIHKRYGSPSKALAFWKHKAPNYNGTNWY